MSTAETLLLQLVAADAAARPDRPPFLFYKAGGGVEAVSHRGLQDHEIRAHEADVLDLEASGFLRFLLPAGGAGITFHVTDDGRRRARELDETRRASAGGAVNEHALDWNTRALPVLQAVAREFSRSPSSMGVRAEAVVSELGDTSDAHATGLVLEELVRGGYLDETLGGDQLPGPAWCRLTEKGLQVTAGWPTASGDAAFERLLALIDERITAAATEDEQTKWERLREGILGIGRDVFVGVLTTTVNAAAKNLAG